MTILNDGDAAMRYITSYLTGSPQAAEGLRVNPGWFFSPLASRPDWARAVGSR
jgi:hypothetical protein